MSFTVTFKTKWADFDPNNHMRHTAYNDYAAESRVRFFNANGFSLLEFNKINLGPVLFREETNFYREISIGEDIKVEVYLKAMSEKGERFKLLHKIFKQNDVLAAEIEIYAAWLDLIQRKLTIPPSQIISTFNALEKIEDFEIISIKKK